MLKNEIERYATLQFATVLILCAFTATAFAQPVMLRSGDIILTRNVDAVGNPNGYFNHSAIVVLTAQGFAVVEMQQDFNTAIMVRAEAFFRRCPEYCIIRHRNYRLADNASRFAQINVGIPEYRLLASLKPCVRFGGGDNCVSFVRRSYVAAGAVDPRWIRPDSVFKFCHLSGFHIVGHFRYADYEIPDDFYEGLIR